jgi:hypothetical protein
MGFVEGAMLETGFVSGAKRSIPHLEQNLL